jgi:Uma2 family endonuclease
MGWGQSSHVLGNALAFVTIASMSTSTTLVTVEEYLRLPEPGSGHYELHHGEVVLMPPPKWGHEEIQDKVQEIFKRLLDKLGRARMEMSFRPTAEYEVWRADVGVVLNNRASCTDLDGYLQGAPDLVVEVLSPSNTAEEINEKMAICLENGCSSFWIIDPKRKEVHVAEGKISRRYEESDVIDNETLGGGIHVSEIFYGLRSAPA